MLSAVCLNAFFAERCFQSFGMCVDVCNIPMHCLPQIVTAKHIVTRRWVHEKQPARLCAQLQWPAWVRVMCSISFTTRGIGAALPFAHSPSLRMMCGVTADMPCTPLLRLQVFFETQLKVDPEAAESQRQMIASVRSCMAATRKRHCSWLRHTADLRCIMVDSPRLPSH